MRTDNPGQSLEQVGRAHGRGDDGDPAGDSLSLGTGVVVKRSPISRNTGAAPNVAKRRLDTQQLATLALAEADSLSEALPLILRAVCENLEWDVGAFWAVDSATQRLVCMASFPIAAESIQSLAAVRRPLCGKAHDDLVWRVLISGRPLWVDAGNWQESALPPLNLCAGIDSVCVFPVVRKGELFGVFQFLNRTARPPESDMDAMMAALAAQVAQFMTAKQAEQALERERDVVRQGQRAALLGQLVGGFVHDLNNLLSVITGCSELLMSGHGTSRDLALEIHRAGIRAAAYARQMLNVGRSRPQEGHFVNVNDVIRESTPLLERLLGNHVRLITHLDSSVRLARADGGEFEQVLLNLAINAREVMPSGGTVNIATSNVDVSTAPHPAYPRLPPGAYVMIAVTDSGWGMSEEVKDRLFEPFFTTKPPGKGTGLGLTTVQRIAQATGGQVFVESELGQGACFRVFLPWMALSAHAALAAADSVHDKAADTAHEGKGNSWPRGW